MRFGIFPRKGSGEGPGRAWGARYLEAQSHSELSKTSPKKHVGAEAALHLHHGHAVTMPSKCILSAAQKIILSLGQGFFFLHGFFCCPFNSSVQIEESSKKLYLPRKFLNTSLALIDWLPF